MSLFAPFLIFIAVMFLVQIAAWLYQSRNPLDDAAKRSIVLNEIAAKFKQQGIENYKAAASVQFSTMVDRRRFILWAQQEYMSRDITLDELKDEYLAIHGKTFGAVSGMLYGKPTGILHTKTAHSEIRSLTDAEVFDSGPCKEKYEAETTAMLKRLAEWNRRIARDRTADIVTEELFAARGRL